MTDGPYAETKEQMGGFWLIQAADLDAALEWAAKATAACERPIESDPRTMPDSLADAFRREAGRYLRKRTNDQGRDPGRSASG